MARIDLPEGVKALEWTFESPDGVVTLREENGIALCRAIRADAKGGVWKAWLLGTDGTRALLGTLIPEGGALRLRRAVPLEQLQRQGVWPPIGTELLPAETPRSSPVPEGWQYTDCPARLMGEADLRHGLRCVERVLFRREGDEFFLAFPFDNKAPFPLPSLCCLCAVARLGECPYLLFRFSHRGCPLPLERTPFLS